MGSSSTVRSLRSALVRPLDRRYPTNLAVMILVPVGGAITGAIALRETGLSLEALEAVIRGAFTAFGGWALAREIAPDDNPAAFVSMALAFLVVLLYPDSSVLPLLTAIMVARIVNRSVGIPARWIDYLAVILLAGWAAYGAKHAGPAIVTAIGLGLDAILPATSKRQTRAVGDLTGKPLSRDRVWAAMVIVVLMALQDALAGQPGVRRSLLVWAVIAGVLLMFIMRAAIPSLTRPGAGRLLLVLLTALTGCGSATQSPAPFASPADTMIDVGGHRLHFRVWQKRSDVTLVFESGGGATLESWENVPQAAANDFALQVIAYDRAGLGSSEVGPMDLLPEREMRGLDQALDRFGARRIILVGHSYGGLLSVYHALLEPARVVGLVLVDPMNTDFIRRVSLAWLNTTVPDIVTPASPRDTVIVRMKRTIEALVAESEGGIASLEIPVVVITAGIPFWGDPGREAAWRASHETIAGMKPNRRLLVASRSRHGIPETDPDSIIEAIGLLLRLLPESQ